jgi:hypothetical protein
MSLMSKSDLPNVNRRTVFAGATAVGALGAIAAASGLVTGKPAPASHTTADAKAAEAAGAAQAGGYQLTDHVKQYYATARI